MPPTLAVPGAASASTAPAVPKQGGAFAVAIVGYQLSAADRWAVAAAAGGCAAVGSGRGRGGAEPRGGKVLRGVMSSS